MYIKLLIADDHPIVCTGIRKAIVGSKFVVVGSVELPERLIVTISKLRPDVLVTEVRLNGIDVIKILENHSVEKTGCQILFYSANSNPTSLARACPIGSYDYLLKSAPTNELVQGIKNAVSGKPAAEKSLLKKTKTKILATSNWDRTGLPLTQREQQVLQHIAMGLSNREIGRSLGISIETVKEHVQNILRKLDANDRTQAAVWAVREGLI